MEIYDDYQDKSNVLLEENLGTQVEVRVFRWDEVGRASYDVITA